MAEAVLRKEAHCLEAEVEVEASGAPDLRLKVVADE